MLTALSWEIIKYLLTGYTIILVPVYWYYYGPANFLWFSDIGLFLTVIALWLESALIMSIAAVGILAVELFWCIDFFIKLFFKMPLKYMADYMFMSSYPLSLRFLSLFHLVTPAIWVLYVYQYGYDTRAVYYFLLLFWLVLGITYCCTSPEKNINWVFLPTVQKIPITQTNWFLLQLFLFPVLILMPTHIIFKKVFPVIEYRDNR